MTRAFIEHLQKRVAELLKKAGDKPLAVLAQNYCHEIAYLAGNWILDEFPTARVYMLKGIIGKGVYHDMLLVEYEGKVYAIDPAIWRFFKHKKTVLVSIKQTMPEAISEVQKIYDGIWRIAEKMQKSGFEKRLEWERRVETKMDELV